MKLGANRAQLFDGPLQLLDSVRFPRIDGSEEREPFRMPSDDCRHHFVGEGRPVCGGLRIPGEENAEDLFLRKLNSELVHRSLVHLASKVASCRLSVRAHAALQPLLNWQMDVQVDGPDQAMRRAAPRLRR